MATLFKVLENGYEFKDGGSRSEAINFDIETNKIEVVGDRPIVGYSLLVGSCNARTYGSDYWLTTEVTEILEETENEVKFKTKNSIYLWTK